MTTGRKGAARRRSWAVVVLIVVAAAHLVSGSASAASVLGPYRIEANSMAPNVVDGDIVLVDPTFSRIPFGDLSAGSDLPPTGEPARGDIVMFTALNGDGVYIKRIVALPGETVSLRGGRVAIEGTDIAVARETDDGTGGDGIDVERAVETLPGNVSYAILDRGDFPADSFGPATVPEGHYFVLGDNRDNSVDSRAGEIGMIPRSTIIGRAWTLD
ncbi:signal peptidase I [Fulvimarina sp. 2208YS6-2-32]|uniref:Signal peptidase I n=1 Tax=Fulvimarina uroteuthidis TaxID=3098149 RepID=A0ABU5I767_9HYPH|nr:signal peptidase I [Fulvimarina sp. 2208YS6-2-32]MDY8110763.1 signal peptidase I [Fulvimarina sp. 2208YS6-2-32]